MVQYEEGKNEWTRDVFTEKGAGGISKKDNMKRSCMWIYVTYIILFIGYREQDYAECDQLGQNLWVTSQETR